MFERGIGYAVAGSLCDGRDKPLSQVEERRLRWLGVLTLIFCAIAGVGVFWASSTGRLEINSKYIETDIENI
ncbi:hypothetical protein QO002_006154 [Pararhizobium capsulatum DSM 1112]|uniref:Uncharacterized protein n=1 Tax=Pararhizobium capsulatum DSM 1112 TaxID=1121113 RepID=A0ABU0C4D6_9HYPH|nr:hypothetical protein [Pararhizobium capsulatum]MDQ0323947.1 hypothetical protein [Pararhizobium capsulatum DSM 1112]